MTPTGYFLFYAGVTLGTAAYLYTFFPETKGKSLEQVEEYFEAESAKEEETKRRRREKRGKWGMVGMGKGVGGGRAAVDGTPEQQEEE